VGVAGCVVLLALGATERLLEPPPGVTEANLRRIRKGMTLANVEAIFGRAADEQTTGISSTEPTCFVVRTWRGQAWDATVSFGQDSGRVCGVFRTNAGAGPSVDTEGTNPLDSLRSLFGW
jgi:hypothetical protein